MRALVVYESMFGNTEVVADAVAAGIGEVMQVEVVEASSAPEDLPADVDLLVVGGPTHAFGMSRPSTRREASERPGADVTSVASGLREWLAWLPPVYRPVRAATFDTRVRWPPVPGSAARVALRTLRRKGYHRAGRRTFWAPGTPAHRTFWVRGTTGPLLGDEGDRARRWGVEIARSVGTGTLSTVT